MREVIDELLAWWQSGMTAGLATVVATFQSAPRPAGAAMAVGPDGTAAGSISGGCVEGAVYDLAEAMVGGAGPTLQRYGISDGDAFAVGLTCGGIMDVFIEPVNQVTFPELAEVASAIRERRPVALATTVDGPADQIGRRIVVWADRATGTLGNRDLDLAVSDDARGMLAAGQTGIRHYGLNGERRVDEVAIFVSAFAPPPRMIVFGSTDFAVALTRVGKFLGYHVTLCDARPVFATAKRFPDVDELVVEWPHKYLQHTSVDERTVICVLTHDPKFDAPVLEAALRLPVAYVGAMGSRRTHENRLAELRNAGLSERELSRLFSPVGLDLGSRTPEETAVSIAAEIIASTWGRSGQSLRELRTPIHHGFADHAYRGNASLRD